MSGHAPRRGRRWQSRWSALSILLVLSLIPAAGPVHSSTQPIDRSFASVAGQPDIVLVVTDDQRWDTLWAMPRVQELLASRGITFTNAFNTNPFCCPARASILKGAYSHGTRVYQNSGTFGPFPGFNDSSSIATWLDAAGYRTALIGKYFNGYTSSRASYIPPGWDRWVAFAMNNSGGGGFTNYDLSVDGTLVHRGSATTDYSTDVLGEYADEFVRSTPTDTPLFLMFTPYAPHQPAAVAARHAKAFPGLAPYRPPSYDEADVSDKPAFIRKLAPLSASTKSRLDTLRVRQLRSLLAVDDAVARIVSALDAGGRLDNTMIVFASDNGFLLGEHRWDQKRVVYEESIRMPLVVRYDPLIGSPRSDPNLVLNIDLAPTFAALAGVSAPGAEGSSLLGLLSDPATAWRSDILIENKGSAPPTYCAVRNARWVYVQYSSGEEELYDLLSDPYQLQSLVTDTAAAQTLTSMRLRLRELCSPPPPGFKFTH
jgi:N-acetylglucosamine-6-sulfatase